MTKLVYILQWILIGALAGAVCFLGITRCSAIKKNTQLSQELHECRNAPIQIDTIHDTIRIVDIQYIKPKPKPDDNPGLPPTTNTRCDDIYPTYYSETFNKKGVKISWEARAECSGDSAILGYIRFPEIIIPKDIVVETKTVIDSIPFEVPAKIKSKFLIYGGAVGNSFKEFPGLELGIGYLHKQGWGIMGGPLYVDKTLYGSVKIFVTL